MFLPSQVMSTTILKNMAVKSVSTLGLYPMFQTHLPNSRYAYMDVAQAHQTQQILSEVFNHNTESHLLRISHLIHSPHVLLIDPLQVS